MEPGRDLLDIRIGRLSVQMFARWPVMRAGWNRIPTLLRDFGWFFLWYRGMRMPWER